jgi:hypothetical protein
MSQKINCCKCGDELSRTDEILYEESKEFNPGARPICDECWAMEEERHEDFEDFSDADPGL